MPESVIDRVIPLPRSCPPVIGLGAYLKATATVISGDRAYLSKPVGDLSSAEAIDAYDEMIRRLLDETGITPVLAAHDLHPDFYSSRSAPDKFAQTLAVQHHHAHAAAVAADSGHDGPLLCLALDGFGLGPDQQSWGGELLQVDGASYRRLGHLRRLPQPGGDLAAREPWRMGAAALHLLGRGDEIAQRWKDLPHGQQLRQILDRDLNCPPTSSCGRLFDAACGLLGVRPLAEFEGQAPMELEALVQKPKILPNSWSIENGVLDLMDLLSRLSHLGPRNGAETFHGSLAAALIDWSIEAAEQTGLTVIGLSGGCFFNRVLSGLVANGMKEKGLTVLQHKQASPGDPGVSLGQAWVAAQTVTRQN